MLRIPCPHCGLRDAAEFGYAGERAARPDPGGTTPGQWRAYLYLRRNPAGWTEETWYHRAGCGRHLVVSRHTVTGEFGPVRDAAASEPSVSEASGQAAAPEGTAAASEPSVSEASGQAAAPGDTAADGVVT